MSTYASASNTAQLIKAIKAGKSIIVFAFSRLFDHLPDIHAILPTDREAAALQFIGNSNPSWTYDLEDGIISEYVPISYERDWLLTDAPAGLASAVAHQLLRLANPVSLDQMNAILDEARSLVNYRDNFHAVLVGTCGFNSAELQQMDIYQLAKTIATFEPMLLGRGMIEEPFVLTPPEQQEMQQYRGAPSQVRDDGPLSQKDMGRTPTSNSTPSPKIKSPRPNMDSDNGAGFIGGIDLEAENKRFQEHGLIASRERINEALRSISP